MAEYDKDDIVPPSWLDRSFLEDVLDHFDSGAKLIEFNISPGCKPGEHFMSVMFKVCLQYNKVNGVKASVNTILKTVPECEGHKKEYVEQTPCFKNELRVYEKVLSKMQQMLTAVGDSVKIAPK